MDLGSLTAGHLVGRAAGKHHRNVEEPSGAHHWSAMTLQEARVILDTARAGGLVPERYITEALVVTGDLTPFRRDQLAAVVQQESEPA